MSELRKPGKETSQGEKPLEKWRLLIFGAATLFVFAAAAYFRSQLPGTILFNPDSWGYIGPALIYQETGIFPQVHTRGFFYPALLNLALKLSGGNLHALVVWQQAMGFAAGIIWFLLWFAWMRMLPDGWLGRWAAPWIGLAGCAVFLLDGTGMIFSQHLRPEAVFPFFALLQLLFIGWAMRCAAQKRGASAFICMALGTVATFASVALKPSWTLTILTLPIALLLIMATTKYLRQTLLLFVAVIVGALCWKVGIRTWQAALKWQPDPSAKLFLSKSLVSVHADLVLRTMTDTAQFPNFPEELAAAYEQSRQEIEPYALLGFNPDTIFYNTPVFSNLHGTVDETHRFLMNRYFGALKNAPFAMMTKWLRQLGIALFPEKKWIFRDSYQLRRDYERSAAELRLRAEIESVYPGAAGKAAAEALRAEAVAETMPPRTIITLKIGGAVLEAIRVLIPLGILLSLVSGIVAVLSPKLPWRACAIEAFFWCATLLGAVAAVAIVHSFDIDRYGEILTFLYLLMACYAAVAIGWLAEQFVQKIRTSKRLPKL